MRYASMLLVLAVGFAAMPAAAQVTKWVDEKGRVQYSDKPPAGNTAKSPPKSVPTQKTAPVVNPKKPPPQPKYHVPGDPLVERMRENEERRERERLTAKCWKENLGECNEAGVIYQIGQAEKKAAAEVQKPNPREPLPPDFCKRNPKVEACMPKK